MRIEHDYIGEMELPEDALIGINAMRARNAFPNNRSFNVHWFKALGLVKKSIYLSYEKFIDKVKKAYSLKKLSFDEIACDIIEVMCVACDEILDGKHYDSFKVPAVSGGAGTAINMNINEIITNLSLLKLNRKCGEYDFIHPIEHANIFQSTNDVVPTALKVAIISC